MQRTWDPSIDPTFRRGQCMFFTYPWETPPVFEEDMIRNHGPEVKTDLFAKYLPQHRAQIEHGKQVLKRLEKIDPGTAALFEVKPYLIDSMTLRLMNGESSEPPKSYTAISYCWPEKPVAPAAKPGPGLRHIPVTPTMYQHAILQRETADEGIWCDQLCIDQSNAAEKGATIAAMDAIYTCARIVLVIIDDVEVTEQELLFLRAFVDDYEDKKHPLLPPPYITDTPPFMDRNPILLEFYTKLLKARWFQRAWCSHEMRLGKRHRFLVRCAGTGPGTTLLSFSDFFISYLNMLSASVHMEQGVAKDTREVVSRIFSFPAYLDDLRRARGFAPVGRDKADMTVTQPYTTQIAEIFSLGASGDPTAADRELDANLDRIIIVLNSVGSGLALKREEAAKSPLTSTAQRCQQLLYIISLAARDPTALCTNGKPFRLLSPRGAGDNTEEGPCSWLRKPAYSDIGSGGERQEPLPRMHEDDLRGLWLDTSAGLPSIVVGTYHAQPLEEPSDWFRHIAGLMVKDAIRIDLGGGILGMREVGPEFLSWRAEADHEACYYSFRDIIAIILQFGPAWLVGMVAKCGFSGDTIRIKMVEDVEVFFPIADNNRTAPFDTRHLGDSVWTSTAEGIRAVNSILRVAHWILAWSTLHLVRTSDEQALWRAWICSFDDGRIPGLVIAPDGLTATIPAGLMQYEYSRLPRVWLLDPGKEDDEFALVGKSVLFANLTESNVDHIRSTCQKEYPKISGPPNP